MRCTYHVFSRTRVLQNEVHSTTVVRRWQLATTQTRTASDTNVLVLLVCTGASAQICASNRLSSLSLEIIRNRDYLISITAPALLPILP